MSPTVQARLVKEWVPLLDSVKGSWVRKLVNLFYWVSVGLTAGTVLLMFWSQEFTRTHGLALFVFLGLCTNCQACRGILHECDFNVRHLIELAVKQGSQGHLTAAISTLPCYTRYSEVLRYARDIFARP